MSEGSAAVEVTWEPASVPLNEASIPEAPSAPMSEGSVPIEVAWEAEPSQGRAADAVTRATEPSEAVLPDVVGAAHVPASATGPRPASGVKRWVGVALLALCAAALVFVLTRRKPAAVPNRPAPARASEAQQARPTPAPPPVAPPASAEVEQPTGPMRVQLNVRPAGALVFDGSKRLGPAPLSVELEPGQTRTLQVIARGYADRKVVLDGSLDQVDIALKRFRSANLKTNKAR
jgi:hypothetical protein